MRFPSRLLAANLVFAAMVWAAFYAVVTLVTVGIAVFGTLDKSAWEAATQLPRWFALFVGVALIREFFPLYIAHGQTRRQFGAQAAVTVALYAPFLSALLVAGYLLERLLYGLAGWPQALGRPHLFTSPAQVPLVFTEYLIEFLAWIVAGAFMAAAFYRWEGGGLLSVPLGIGLILLGEAAVGAELRLPFVHLELGIVSVPGVATALAAGLGCFLLGLAMTWSIIRDVPLRNRLP
ncbi:hypothetical protein [Planomonospora venezuelensis]|uniref:Uncharacterized protein n=1 Tax=Planomonospora venezuelensis TaxID=1999 RepID=A0A841CXQ8_PLAVE|nr:hypothetical protein [Planomonospora venezuelensis]MBB5963182.1 hypothetical protein [Planomonospora venezuelensis]GIN00059.1 hypothetical protein Pve01_17170 [Planomonospora venezuelensis]